MADSAREHEGKGAGPPDPEHKCCGVVDEAVARSRSRRERRKQRPMNWLVLKLAVGITVGIIAYSTYVYVGRLCVPMIRRRADAAGGRGLGVAFLVVFCVLLLMLLWSYEKIVLTPPGLARDHAQKSERPVLESTTPAWWDAAQDYSGTEFQYVPPTQGEELQREMEVRPPRAQPKRLSAGTHTDEDGEANAGVTDAIPPVAEARVAHWTDSGTLSPSSNGHANAQLSAQPKQQRPTQMYTRQPQGAPVLLPAMRYCQREEFVKPPRAHHCRACGTCILRYDHHCPWIGQCVGARNHKFFLIFNEWTWLFCVWTFSTLMASVIRTAKRQHGHVDPQKIVVIVFAAMFAFFTSSLIFAHVDLIMHNQTTVESLGIRRMKDAEKRKLSRMHRWYEFGAKRRTRQQWDAEWGRIGCEGNLWWLGSYRANWESVMGESILGWFLPIGHSPLDGLSFPTNPRFDAEGRWKPRREWPQELQ